MMKKAKFIIALTALIVLASCGLSKTENNKSAANENANDVTLPDYVDITPLNANLKYAMFCDIGNNSDKYIGKTIKTDGLYTYTDIGEKRYFSVCVFDETKCCQAGLDFECSEEYSFPEDYPEKIGDTISVEGTLDTYEENGTVYCCLKNAKLEITKGDS